MAKRDERPRDRNKYAGGCAGCPAWVKAGEGFLYRHSGANLGRMSRGRKKFAYVVRCEACALQHDGPNGRAALAVDAGGCGVGPAGRAGAVPA